MASNEKTKQRVEQRERNIKSQKEIREKKEQERVSEQIGFTLKSLPEPTTKLSDGNVLRYPDAASGGGSIDANSDYVLFEFYKYAPPFKSITGSRPDQQPGQRTNTAASDKNYFDYNQIKQYDKKLDGEYKPIIMYMPEDISTGFRGNWGGKAFSNIAAGVLRSAGADGLSKLDNLSTTADELIKRVPQQAGRAIIQKAVQKITGDSLSNDDIFGSISGAILNPNVELLFQGSDLRNFQLNFKLVPRNSNESVIINEICKIFKMCTLPQRDPGNVFGASNQGVTAGFIGVPNLCRVSFMKGGDVHPVLPIYKMCAITQVDVNYTPDGVYATYGDDLGQPVAIDLALNFQETKLVFADEVSNNSIR
jgi:hypothetical protein